MLAPIIRKTQRSAAFDPEGKVKFLKAAWDAVASEFGRWSAVAKAVGATAD